MFVIFSCPRVILSAFSSSLSLHSTTTPLTASLKWFERSIDALGDLVSISMVTSKIIQAMPMYPLYRDQLVRAAIRKRKVMHNVAGWGSEE